MEVKTVHDNSVVIALGNSLHITKISTYYLFQIFEENNQDVWIIFSHVPHCLHIVKIDAKWLIGDGNETFQVF